MRRRRVLFLYLGCIALLLSATYVVLLETTVSQGFVESMLARFFSPQRFRLQSSRVNLGSGSVVLTGLELTAGPEPDSAILARMETIEIGVETNPFGDFGEISEITIRGLRVHLDLTQAPMPDLAGLLSDPGEGDQGESTPPPIHLVDSTISLQLSPGVDPVSFRNVDLKLLPVEAGSARVVVSGTTTAPPGLKVHVSGKGNLAKPEFRCLFEIEERSASTCDSSGGARC